jgi:hypothetical protein
MSSFALYIIMLLVCTISFRLEIMLFIDSSIDLSTRIFASCTPGIRGSRWTITCCTVLICFFIESSTKLAIEWASINFVNLSIWICTETFITSPKSALATEMLWMPFTPLTSRAAVSIIDSKDRSELQIGSKWITMFGLPPILSAMFFSTSTLILWALSKLILALRITITSMKVSLPTRRILTSLHSKTPLVL